MPIVTTRQYRSFLPLEPTEGQEYIVEGYATTFDIPYYLEGEGGVTEVILSTAFEGADMTDVIFQYDHEGQVMARVRNHTLELETDAHGLHVRADLSGSQKGRELYEAIRNGLVDRMSWGWTMEEDGWDYDPDENRSTIKRISKVYDVSAVSVPANQLTEIHARSYLDGAIEAALRESEEREECAKRARRALALKAKAIMTR